MRKNKNIDKHIYIFLILDLHALAKLININLYILKGSGNA